MKILNFKKLKTTHRSRNNVIFFQNSKEYNPSFHIKIHKFISIHKFLNNNFYLWKHFLHLIPYFMPIKYLSAIYYYFIVDILFIFHYCIVILLPAVVAAADANCLLLQAMFCCFFLAFSRKMEKKIAMNQFYTWMEICVIHRH